MSKRYQILCNISMFSILSVFGISSMLSIRWISPSFHLRFNIKGYGDLSVATSLSFIILVVFLIWLYLNQKITRLNLAIRVGIILLLCASLFSSLSATDRSLAMYNGTGLLIGIILFLIVKDIFSEPKRVIICIFIIITMGTVFSLKVWNKHLFEMKQSYEYFLRHKRDILKEMGKEEDDRFLKLVEGRLKGGDNGGFFFHSNLAGSYLSSIFFLSLIPILSGSFKKKRISGKTLLNIIIGASILSALFLTKSRGAIFSLLISLIIISVIYVFRYWIRDNLKTFLVISVLITSVCVCSFILYGVKKREFPDQSLTYRWQYWVGSYRIFKHNWLFGTGPGNFRYYYLRYKLPEAPEHIRSPHNMIVQAFCEYGIMGGMGILLLMGGILYQGLRRYVDSLNRLRDIPYDRESLSFLIILLITIFGSVFLIKRYLFNNFFIIFLPYMVVFLLVSVFNLLSNDMFKESHIRLFILGSVICFLIGNMVNFSLFEPSTELLFFILSALLIASYEDGKRLRGRFSKIRYILGIVLCIFYLYFVTIPSYLGERISKEIDYNPSKAYNRAILLSRLYPYDPYFDSLRAKTLFIEFKRIKDRDRAIMKLKDVIASLKEAVGKADIWRFYKDISDCYLILSRMDPKKRETYLKESEAFIEKARSRAPLLRSLAHRAADIYREHIRLVHSPSEHLFKRADFHLKEAIRLDQAVRYGNKGR